MSVKLGSALSPCATKVLFCGAGDLGKEVAIAMQRLGVEVVAVDRYANAPGMQVAHRAHVISMLDGEALRKVIEAEKPDYIVPEEEAIATDTLVELEKEFPSFLKNALENNPQKGEYFLPFVADDLIREGKATVNVLKSTDKWHGVTYREDRENVVNALKEMKEQGIYPQNLWIK